MMPRNRVEAGQRGTLRLRQKIQGTAQRPRMSVCITSKHIYVQFIDDVKRVTLAAASTVTPELKGAEGTVDGAKKDGQLAAQNPKAKKNTEAGFDRGGLRYHGRVKALADAASEAVLKF